MEDQVIHHLLVHLKDKMVVEVLRDLRLQQEEVVVEVELLQLEAMVDLQTELVVLVEMVLQHL